MRWAELGGGEPTHETLERFAWRLLPGPLGVRFESPLAELAPALAVWIGFLYGYVCENLDGRDKVFNPVERYLAMDVTVGRQSMAGKLRTI